jgi:hypothetical protein
MTNNVTANRASSRGRPRQYANAAAKQAAYRARQTQNTGLQIGTRVQCQHGRGIVVALLAGSRAYVGFSDRVWRDVPFRELTIIGQSRKVPTWADPGIRNLKKRTAQLSVFPKNGECFGRMEGDTEFLVRKFRKGSRERKDYSVAINFRLAKLVFDVARNGQR